MNRFDVSKSHLPIVACMIFGGFIFPIEKVVAQTSAASGGSGAAASYTDLGYGQYPRVTEIEQQLLGKTYEKDPLAARVARLETKQFGKASPKDDLADRLDKLDQFVKPKPEPTDDSNVIDAAGNGVAQNGGGGANNANSGAGGAGGATSTASAGPSGHVSEDAQYSASDYGNYPRVTELEQQFLGTTFVKDPLPVRIARLETKKFGKSTPNDDLCDRIDRLDKLAPQSSQLVNNNLDNSNGSSSNSSNSGNGNGSGKGGGIGRAILGMLGNSLGGGMGGGGLGGIGGGGMGLAGLASGLMGNNNNMNSMMPGLQDDANDAATAKQHQSRRHQSPMQQPSESSRPATNSSPFAPDAPQLYGTENKVAAIEKFVLGKEHSELPLEERVAHVEKKLVPYEHHLAGQDVGLRVDHLWSILAAANKSTKSVASAGSSQ
jgi:hypothetical protein